MMRVQSWMAPQAAPVALAADALAPDALAHALTPGALVVEQLPLCSQPLGFR